MVRVFTPLPLRRATFCPAARRRALIADNAASRAGRALPATPHGPFYDGTPVAGAGALATGVRVTPISKEWGYFLGAAFGRGSRTRL